MNCLATICACGRCQGRRSQSLPASRASSPHPSMPPLESSPPSSHRQVAYNVYSDDVTVTYSAAGRQCTHKCHTAECQPPPTAGRQCTHKCHAAECQPPPGINRVPNAARPLLARAVAAMPASMTLPVVLAMPDMQGRMPRSGIQVGTPVALDPDIVSADMMAKPLEHRLRILFEMHGLLLTEEERENLFKKADPSKSFSLQL